MSSADLSYLGLASGLADGSSPRLQLSTTAGRLREVPLSRGQLVAIIKGAANALEYLDKIDRESQR